MKEQNKIISYLQEILSGIIAGAQHHFIHATINKQRWFHKLGDRIIAAAASEKVDSAPLEGFDADALDEIILKRERT